MLTSGSTFQFKVEARNIIGYSPASAVISILCATNPVAPNAPTTVISGAQVTIDWNAPYNSGSPITSYQVLIKQKNGVFSESTAVCNGNEATNFANTECKFLISLLLPPPYSLLVGDSITAKIRATNVVGFTDSTEGNGAIVVTIPSAPVNLAK